MLKIVTLVLSHLIFALGGFAIGVYALPILMAPESPDSAEIARLQTQSSFNGQFRRDLTGSDFLHWGDGQVSISNEAVTLMGSIAPGPDYRLYLSPEFVQTEEEFIALKEAMVQIGPVNTFDNFIVPIAAGVDPAKYTTVVIWCEAFGEFITAARYQ
jgi:hypothetical protein